MPPRRYTPAVCDAVTMRPRISACRAVPREPTRYAATTVLPWPGSRAWKAPRAEATSNAMATTPRLASGVPTSSVKRSRVGRRAPAPPPKMGGSRSLDGKPATADRSEEHTSELQSRLHLVCRLLLEKKKKKDH